MLPTDIRDSHNVPEATPETPFIQIEWVFERIIRFHSNKSTKQNYESGKKFFLEHLHAIGFRGPYLLKKEWDSFCILKLRQELEKRIEQKKINLSPYTLIGHFSAIRYVMKYAASRELTKDQHLLDISYGNATSITDSNTAYEDSELTQILDAIASELHTSRKILSGYVKEEPQIGRDPRIPAPKRGMRGYGFKEESNMRWYFDNVLNSIPITNNENNKKNHNNFLNYASNKHGGLNELYRSWGVSSCFDIDMLMPHVVNLAHLTGLNPGPLATLSIDSYGDSHPATGTPYLRYFKEKVRKNLELHIDILDREKELSDSHDEILDETTEKFLKGKHAIKIAKTFSTVIRATQKIRESLPEDHSLKKRLFIFESRSPRSFTEIKGITSKITSRWCSKISEKYGLINDDGEYITFNLVKFRSTKLTQLALEGRDLLEIQMVAGHKNVRTTIGYLSRKKLEIEGRKVVHDALLNIHKNRKEFTELTENKKNSYPTIPIKVYGGIISDCKNPFDPPQRVKMASNYTPGEACSRFNMCIFCKNVIIFRENLPILAAYLNQINASMESKIPHMPNSGFYEDSKSLIESILNPELSDFSKEDIEWAITEAKHLNPLIDNAVFSGVN